MYTSLEVLNMKLKLETGEEIDISHGETGHEYRIQMVVCRDNLQKEALLNFIGQLLMLVTYHFTYEF
jgi:hypothetical protein